MEEAIETVNALRSWSARREWILGLIIVVVLAGGVATAASRQSDSHQPAHSASAGRTATPTVRPSAIRRSRLRPVTAAEFRVARAALPKLTLRPHDLPAPATADRVQRGGVPGTNYFVSCVAAHARLDEPPLADREFTNVSGYFDGVVALVPSVSRATRLESVLRSRDAGTCALQTMVTFAPAHYRLGTPQITLAESPRVLDESSKVMFQAPLRGPSLTTDIYMDVLSAQSGPFIALGIFVNVGTFNDPSLETTAMQIMARRITHYRLG